MTVIELPDEYPGFVYVATSEDESGLGLVKIGCTSDIDARFANGERDIILSRPDRMFRRTAWNGSVFRWGELEQAILSFCGLADVRYLGEDASWEGSTEAIRVDPDSVLALRSMMGAASQSVRTFLEEMLDRLDLCHHGHLFRDAEQDDRGDDERDGHQYFGMRIRSRFG